MAKIVLAPSTGKSQYDFEREMKYLATTPKWAISKKYGVSVGNYFAFVNNSTKEMIIHKVVEVKDKTHAREWWTPEEYDIDNVLYLSPTLGYANYTEYLKTQGNDDSPLQGRTLRSCDETWILGQLAKNCEYFDTSKYNAPGYIYAIDEMDNKSSKIKIGLAVNVEKRLAGLQSGNSRKLQIVVAAKYDNYAVVDTFLSKLSDYKSTDGWYDTEAEALSKLFATIKN